MNSATLYPWLKAFHVAAAILFAGGTLACGMLLSAPPPTGHSAEILDALRRWNALVTTPAMFAVWALGIVMASGAGWFAASWLQLKLIAVVLLSAIHGLQSARLRRPDPGRRPASTTVWMTVACVVAIAVLAVTKRF